MSIASTFSAFSSSMTEEITVLTNLANNMASVQRLVSGTAYVLGLLFAFKALYSLKTYGESKSMMSSSSNIKEPIIYLFVSSVFLFLPTAMKVMLQSTFGESTVTSYASLEAPHFKLGAIGQPLSLIIQTIGYIAFIRGWLLVARGAGHGQQPGSIGKGFMHVFGGVLAINIVSTLQIVNNTLYGGS